MKSHVQKNNVLLETIFERHWTIQMSNVRLSTIVNIRLSTSKGPKLSLVQTIKSLVYRTRHIDVIYFRTRGTLSFSKNNLDLQLARYLPHRNGTYVEIGANDGIQQSNTKYFESFRGWSGILIEPYGDNFLKLKRNRSRRNYFVNCACVDFSYIGDEINLIYSDLMTTSIGLDTDLKSLETHILQSEKFLKRGSVHTFHADARTMNSILLESPLPNLIDLLSLDVEGAELSVLK
jgi:FkbM family methyltransferase